MSNLSREMKFLIGLGLVFYTIAVYQFASYVTVSDDKKKIKNSHALDASDAIRCMDVLSRDMQEGYDD